MSQTEQLQKIVDELRKPDHFDFWVEYRQRRGWYLVSYELRYFGDIGEFMGTTFDTAKAEIKRFLS